MRYDYKRVVLFVAVVLAVSFNILENIMRWIIKIRTG